MVQFMYSQAVNYILSKPLQDIVQKWGWCYWIFYIRNLWWKIAGRVEDWTSALDELCWFCKPIRQMLAIYWKVIKLNLTFSSCQIRWGVKMNRFLLVWAVPFFCQPHFHSGHEKHQNKYCAKTFSSPSECSYWSQNRQTWTESQWVLG